MKVLVSGLTGLIGTALRALLTGDGHAAVALSRRSSPDPSAATVHWSPSAGEIDASALEGFDAVVHLAGENIASDRWTEQKKRKIRDSRVNGTRLLCSALSGLKEPPRVLVSSSAIGYYGDRGDEILVEESPPGTGFLPEVCREWEAATETAAENGIRVVNLRTGVVLTAEGGALAKMLPVFQMGLGGCMGSGKQWMSWISIDDMVSAICFCIEKESLTGPVNAVSPNPVTNKEFTDVLGHVLGRPTIMPMPAIAARLAFGEMADEALLASTRVEPRKLLAEGYRFHHRHLEEALRHVLHK